LNNKIERLGDFSLPKEEQSDGEGYFLNALFTKTEPKPEEVMPYVIPEAEIIPDIAPDTLPKKDKGKAKETEPEQTEEPQPEASTSKNTEPTEPKELSAESQQIINKIQNIYFTDPAESGNQVEKIFAPEIRQRKTEYQISKSYYIEFPAPFGKEKKIDNTNRLYKLTEKQRLDKQKDYDGINRILFDKLLEKVGTRQKATDLLSLEHVLHSIFPLLPISGNLHGVAHLNRLLPQIDNLQIELEKSFSIAEVKEIVAQTRKADYDQLEAVKN